MILTYAAPDGTEHSWPFKARKIMSVEAEAIERVTGWDFGGQFGQKLMSGSMLARRALVWVFLKRSAPTLKFADVSICMDDVGLAYEDDETDAIAATRSTLPEDQAAAVDQLLADADWVPPEQRTTTAAPVGPYRGRSGGRLTREAKHRRYLLDLAAVFGVRPWELHLLSVEDMDAMCSAIDKIAAQQDAVRVG